MSLAYPQIGPAVNELFDDGGGSEVAVGGMRSPEMVRLRTMTLYPQLIPRRFLEGAVNVVLLLAMTICFV